VSALERRRHILGIRARYGIEHKAFRQAAEKDRLVRQPADAPQSLALAGRECHTRSLFIHNRAYITADSSSMAEAVESDAVAASGEAWVLPWE
jgi:sugar lactone lactonase YvrE